MNTIAVVDDEKNIRDVIRFALEKELYTVEEHPDGSAAWETFQSRLPDLIILDILMPKMDGIELCKRIRTLSSQVPIIFLSSRDEEIDKVLGLESGGDDYVCKPFSIRELMARIRASLRRTAESGGLAEDGTDLFCQGELRLDEKRYFSSWKGTPLGLTVTEFRILRCLTENPGFVKTREQLMQAAFPEDNYPNDRAADSHIKRIRKKISLVDPEFDSLEAVYGLGYRYKDGL